MRVLLDTCVVSEIARRTGSPEVKARVQTVPRNALYLSAITIGELVRGVALLDAGKKRSALEAQLRQLESDYAEHILPIDSDTARLWGEISVTRQQSGRPLPILDGLIGATALRHGLVVFTRNVNDFAGTGARVINPWELD